MRGRVYVKMGDQGQFVEGPDHEQLGYALTTHNDKIIVGNPYVNNNEGNVRIISLENG